MLTTYFVLILAIFIGGIVGAVLIFQAKQTLIFYIWEILRLTNETEFIEIYFFEYLNLDCYLIPIFSERYEFHYFKLFKFF